MVRSKLRKTLSWLLPVALTATLLSTNTPIASAAVVESRGIFLDAAGRSGGKIVVTVISKLPNGTTSTTDSAWAYVQSSGTSPIGGSNFATAATPYKVVDNLAYFRVILNAGDVGEYVVYGGVALSGTTSWDDKFNGGFRYSVVSFDVGGTAVQVKLATHALRGSISPSRSAADLIPSSLVLFDSNGIRTLLSDTETIRLNLTSSPASAQIPFGISASSGTVSANNTELVFTSTANNGDGIFRFSAGNTVAGTSTVNVSLLANGQLRNLTYLSVTTTNEINTGGQSKVLSYSSYSFNSATDTYRHYAVGSDMKLYQWGVNKSGYTDAQGLDVKLRTDVKPTLIDFPHSTTGRSNARVTKIVRGVGNSGAIQILADDGSLWGYGVGAGLSSEQGLSDNLEPIFTPNLSSNPITDISSGLKILLLTDGSVLTRNSEAFNFSTLALTSVGSPVITQVEYMSISGTGLLLAADKKVYSFGSNLYGELGQGSDTATALGQVLFPTGRTVSKIYAGSTFGVVKMVDGSFWSWGDNRAGQQGKLASEVPFSNTPRVIISPVNFTVVDVRVDHQIILLGESIFFYANAGVWAQGASFSNLDAPVGESIVDLSVFSARGSTYIYPISFLIGTSSGRVYQTSGPTGSCSSTYGRIRSDGQFGERWFVDPVQSGSKLYSESATTVQIDGPLSVKVNTTFSLQVANVRTSCYQTSELQFAWDKDGNGSFETPDAPIVGDTGYLGLNATFNFSSAGRKVVSLGVTTPDSVTLAIPFVIGVEPTVRTTLPNRDTSTVEVVSNGLWTLAIAQDGRVNSWGRNNSSQLGVSSALYASRSLPMPVPLPDTVTPISLAILGNTSLVVDSVGRVWGFGQGTYIDGTSNNYASPRQVLSLQGVKVREIKSGIVLTTDGRLFTWNSNLSLTPFSALAGIYIKSFAYRGYSSSCGFEPTTSDYYSINAVDSDGVLWRVALNSSFVPGEVAQLDITGAASIKGSGSAVVTTNAGEIFYSGSGGCGFGLVSKPGGVTLVDAAPYGSGSNTIAMTDSAKVVWTNSISQSTGIFQPGTWTRLSEIEAVRTSTSDSPKLYSEASRYVGFASGRIYSSVYSYENDNATCGSNPSNRVYSTGQFGSSYFSDAISVGSSVAFVGSSSSISFASGQTLATQPGDSLIVKLTSPRSSCFSGAQQLTASADLDGNGSYESPISSTNESGTYSFISTTTAPTSGRRTFSFKIETPIGTQRIFTVNVGVYGSTPNASVTTRTQVVQTGYRTSFAVGSDGFGFAWGGGMNFMNILTNTPPRTYLKPTKIQIPGNPQIVDGAVYSNWDYDADFGLLVVDANGKVWSWGTRVNMDSPASTFISGSVPTTPTQISALNSVTIKRISVTGDGYSALALADNGNVYQWNESNRTPTLVPGLAGTPIKNIWASGDFLAALSVSGELYTWNGRSYYLGRPVTVCQFCYDTNPKAVLISDAITDVTSGNAKSESIHTALTSTGKLYSWGRFKSGEVYTPEETTLPGLRTPLAIGSNASSIVIVATDKTWWRQALDVNRNIVYYQISNVPTEILNNFAAFSTGTAVAVRTTGSLIYTQGYNNQGSCGPRGTFTRVMSDGQFGSTYAADSIELTVGETDISRPNEDNYFNFTASSTCFGGESVTVTADLSGTGTYSNPLSSAVSENGSEINGRFKFRPTTTGPMTITVRAVTSAGIIGTSTISTLVVPLPPAGRQIGVSINGGARYTNSSNVTLDLVWPDGVYKIYVSNDGGFAPGTVTEIDLQTQIQWVLPPQAVIPLPSIVYARFGESSQYFFDDIILDAISPILTFASAR
jgi:alpha-tubulin suppressor-like RCC1 family protein